MQILAFFKCTALWTCPLIFIIEVLHLVATVGYIAKKLSSVPSIKSSLSSLAGIHDMLCFYGPSHPFYQQKLSYTETEKT